MEFWGIWRDLGGHWGGGGEPERHYLTLKRRSFTLQERDFLFEQILFSTERTCLFINKYIYIYIYIYIHLVHENDP